jgi:methylmalonyl-CoA mutase cobalamin-binding subunit
MGIKAVFGPGTPIEETAKFIRESVRPLPGLTGEGQ